MIEKKFFIGIDLSFVRPDHKNGGIETYIKNLMHGFEELNYSDEILYFVHEDTFKEYQLEFSRSHFQVYKSILSHKLRMLIFQTLTIPRIVKKYGIKVIFEPTYTSGFLPFSTYTIISNPHDLQHKYYPKNFTWLRRLYINITSFITFFKSKRVIAISEYVQKTLCENYPFILKNKVFTIYNPIRFIEESCVVDWVDYKYILSVNALRKNKNIITLLKAYKLIKTTINEKLVLVGIKQDDTDDIMSYIKEHNLLDNVVIAPFITDEQLKWLYENASLFVTTSLYEGFGMTPVEAMGYGCPTLSSKDTSLYEVTKGLAEYYEPTQNEQALADKILNILRDRIIIETEKNKKIIRQEYDYRIISQKYYAFFHNIANFS